MTRLKENVVVKTEIDRPRVERVVARDRELREEVRVRRPQ
jgi:hypothetical protein